jgi:hypothetical protein
MFDTVCLRKRRRAHEDAKRGNLSGQILADPPYRPTGEAAAVSSTTTDHPYHPTEEAAAVSSTTTDHPYHPTEEVAAVSSTTTDHPYRPTEDVAAVSNANVSDTTVSDGVEEGAYQEETAEGDVESTSTDVRTCLNEDVCGCLERTPTLHRPSCGLPKERKHHNATVPQCLNPEAELEQVFQSWASKCHVKYPRPAAGPRFQLLKQLSKQCLRPDRGQDGTKNAMLLLGDSHAGMLLDGLHSRFDGSFSVRYFGVSGSWCCGFCSLKSYSYALQAGWIADADDNVKDDAMERCDNYAKVVMKSLPSLLRPGDIVIVSNMDHWGPLGLHDEMRALGTRMEELHNVVHSQGAILVLVGPSPVLSYISSECVPAEICDVSLNGHQALWNLYAHLGKKMNGTLFFDIQKFLCDDTHCGVMIPGTQVKAYFDKHHVSLVASQYLAQFLCSALSKAGWLPNGTGHILQ